MGEQTIRIVVPGHESMPERHRSTMLRLRTDLEQAVGADGRAELDIRETVYLADGADTAKGEAITLGAIVVTLISSGTITAIVNQLFEHFKRDLSQLEIEAGGARIKISAADVADKAKREAINDIVRSALRAMDDE